MSEAIEASIREMGAKNNWKVNENTVKRISKAKDRFYVSNGEDWKRCPCYPPSDTIHGCGTTACTDDIMNNGVCHCNLYLKQE